MALLRRMHWIAVAALVMAPGQVPPPREPATNFVPLDSAADVSVMTYNVKGLPWPLASDRAVALEAIGDRLADMRRVDAQPRVVLLQEAFSDAARQIAERAGYRHLAFGPQNAPVAGPYPLGAQFAADARWDRGEGEGSLLDSGLLIMSDYPIVRTEVLAFPQGACAGFDCLAAKGVLIAWIDVPGSERPVAFVNTHLNSRGATHVAPERADAAFAWQMAQVSRFVADNVDPQTPVVFGGDFNVGDVPARERSFAAAPPLGAGQVDGLATLLARNAIDEAVVAEALSIASRNKDLLLYRNPTADGSHLAVRRGLVPFPFQTSASPLSDHPGMVIEFAFE